MSELDRPRHMPPALFVVAGIVAVGLHAGGVALAFMSTCSPTTTPDLGAPAIEIGVELMPRRKLDPTDLPVGPDTDASAPSPAVVEQKAVVEQTDLPKAQADRNR